MRRPALRKLDPQETWIVISELLSLDLSTVRSWVPTICQNIVEASVQHVVIEVLSVLLTGLRKIWFVSETLDKFRLVPGVLPKQRLTI